MSDYAGFWVRVSAGILDLVFLIPPIFVLFHVLDINFVEALRLSLEGQRHADGNAIDVISMSISVIYLTYFVAKKGQATPGKTILKLYVGNVDGSQLSAVRSFGRAMASLVTAVTLGLGFLPVAFTKEKVSLHDFICKTRVFRGKKS